jgi:hypothetical protein
MLHTASYFAEPKEADVTPPSSRDATLIQMIEQNDEKHEKMHARLRQDLDRLEEQVNKGLESLRLSAQSNLNRIEGVERMPVDATKLMLRTPVVVSILVTLLSVAFGIAGTWWTMRSGLDRLADKMESARQLQEASAQIQKMQIDMLSTAVKDVKNNQTMKQFDVQEVKDILMAGKAKPR